MAYPYDWTYNPASTYGAPGGQSAVDMPIVSGPNGFLANNEDAAYYRQVMPFAYGNDAFSNFVRGKMTEVLRNFRAAQATNPNLQVQNFLQPLTEQSFRSQYEQIAPWQRGESGSGQMNAGRLKWYAGSR
jgi:hypothetical protein